jgi:hypothetical protein
MTIITQMYTQVLSKGDTIAQEHLRLLLGATENLLEFQQSFLDRVKDIAQLLWHDQEWGRVLIPLVSFVFIPSAFLFDPLFSAFFDRTQTGQRVSAL